MTSLAFRLLGRPRWMALIIFSIAAAALAATWLGLQQPVRHTATTFIYGSRIGILDRPDLLLDDQLNELVNAVEFPDVFLAIEDRTLLSAEDDFDFTIQRVDDSPSVVAIEVKADTAGNAERIARILAEEVVTFVLRRQDQLISGEIGDVEGQLAVLVSEQRELRLLTYGVTPTRASERLEQELGAIDEIDPVSGQFEADLLAALAVAQSSLGNYERSQIEINRLGRDLGQLENERLELTAAIEAVNRDWYRSITPVEPTSNVPLAIAMAFAAAVPTAVVSTTLVLMNLNRRIRRALVQSQGHGPVLA